VSIKSGWNLLGFLTAAAHGLAHAQHTGDKIVEWGFTKMNEAGKAKPAAAPKNPYVRKAENAGRSVLGLIGKAGRAYYERYEELKKKT